MATTEPSVSPRPSSTSSGSALRMATIPPGVFCRLGQETVPLRDEPEALLEIEAAGGVGGAVLPERVPGYHVGARSSRLSSASWAARAKSLTWSGMRSRRRAGSRQKFLRRLRYPATLSRKHEALIFSPISVLYLVSRSYPPRVAEGLEKPFYHTTTAFNRL